MFRSKLWSKLIPYPILFAKSRLDHMVMLYDVGHGDCVLLMDRYHRGLLVDCGTIRPKLHAQVPEMIENILPMNNECGFIVSHYHFDHYSLFKFLRRPELIFSKVYVPDLPTTGPGREAVQAIKSYLIAAVLTDYSYYRILPEISERVRQPITPCRKGEYIKESGLNLKVLWPDLSHPILGNRKIINIASEVRTRIEPFLNRHNITIPSGEETEYSALEQFLGKLMDLRYREVLSEEREEAHRILGDIEGSFKSLANLFSLVVNTHRKRSSRFLFLGDIDDSILDQIQIPGKRYYNCLKSAHHGTYFGKALRNISAEFILVSRNQKEFQSSGKIHDGYISNIDYRIILSTEFLGHCCIYPY